MKSKIERIKISDYLQKQQNKALRRELTFEEGYYQPQNKKVKRDDGSVRSFFIDITALVQELVSASEIKNGLVVCSSLHTTSSVIINHFEKGLLNDIFEDLKKKYIKKGYQHNNWDTKFKNADAHMMSIHCGKTGVTVINNGKLILGHYENIIYAEFDARDNKSFSISIFGE